VKLVGDLPNHERRLRHALPRNNDQCGPAPRLRREVCNLAALLEEYSELAVGTIKSVLVRAMITGGRVFDADPYVVHADNEDRPRLDRLVKGGYLTVTPVNVGDLMYVVTKRGVAARS
jgi:hypothetical protein